MDWSPATANLRHLLAGTNLFVYSFVLDVLAKTEVSPALARDILGDNHHLVLAYLDARRGAERERRHTHF